MIIEPLPGATLDRIKGELRQVESDFVNLRGAGRQPQDLYFGYIGWVNEACQTLSRSVSTASLDRLVLTRRFWLLQSMSAQSHDHAVRHLLNAELDELSRTLEVVTTELDLAIARWSRPGRFVVLDTSFYLEHPDKLEEIQLAPLLKIWEDPIHILVPILVVDELDKSKRSGDKHVRWRAGYSLAVLDRLLANPGSPTLLRADDFEPLKTGGIPRGGVSIEIVFDPPGHSRLPIPDDEIVDRALVCQTLAHRSLTLFTYDTGQAFRARMVGLEVEKMTVPDPDGT
jgi:PIN domain-containing protein